MANSTPADALQTPCEHCDDKRYRTHPKDARARAQVCDHCLNPCPECNGRKFVHITDDRGYTYAKPCQVCGPLRERIEAFNQANIPAKYCRGDATLQHFETKDPNTGEPIGNLGQIKLHLFRWVQGFAPGEDGFVLHGKVGTGKTHLIAAIVRHLTLEKGIRARFIEFTHLLSDIKKAYDQGEGETSMLEPLEQVPVLAVDELGKGRNTDWQLSVIDEIISKRYNRGLTTLFTTNYPLDSPDRDDKAKMAMTDSLVEETLRERIGERIFSRLYEMAEFLHLDAPDYRKQRRKRA